jgi:hypothetical protein
MYLENGGIKVIRHVSRGKSPIMGRFPNEGRYIVSYQEVLRSAVKNINH